jgi:protein subunit release factor B
MAPGYSRADGDLLAECAVETFRAAGPGGQNVNRRETAVRLRHRPSGLTVQCQRERSQYQNKRLALEELRRRLDRLHRRRRPRIATAPSPAVRERILEAKHRQGRKKKERSKPHPED